MSELDNICSEMLDNAELQIDLDSDRFSLLLTFYVIGSDKKIEFRCFDLKSFSIQKPASETPYFVVLETRVTPPRQQLPTTLSAFELEIIDPSPHLWEVVIEGSVRISIKAMTFSWEAHTLSAEELRSLRG